MCIFNSDLSYIILPFGYSKGTSNSKSAKTKPGGLPAFLVSANGILLSNTGLLSGPWNMQGPLLIASAYASLSLDCSSHPTNLKFQFSCQHLRGALQDSPG